VNWVFLIVCVDYIGEFELVDDHRNHKIVVELLGRVNKCGVISPRFDVKNNVPITPLNYLICS
jgi:small subunit ribosomal protein S15Ae